MSVTAPGPHGGDARVLARSLGLDPEAMLDLSVSTNPFAPDPGPVVAARITAGDLARYPDARDDALAREALAEVLEVGPGRLLVTNGGAEAIALVASELGRGWVDEPDFSLYRRHLATLDPTGPRFRSDPHNPTGQLAGDDQAAEVWDEAFYPLATGRWTRLGSSGDDRMPQYRPVPRDPPGPQDGRTPRGDGRMPRDRPAVVVGSLTKVLGCPGLRLGYVVTPEDDGHALGCPGLRGRLADRQPRWSVSTPALAALPELVRRADIQTWAEAVSQARAALVTLLAEHGVVARPSDANFVLVDGVPGLRDDLARQSVVVRDAASFGLPGSVRIAVPDERGLARLARALEAVR